MKKHFLIPLIMSCILFLVGGTCLFLSSRAPHATDQKREDVVNNESVDAVFKELLFTTSHKQIQNIINKNKMFENKNADDSYTVGMVDIFGTEGNIIYKFEGDKVQKAEAVIEKSYNDGNIPENEVQKLIDDLRPKSAKLFSIDDFPFYSIFSMNDAFYKQDASKDYESVALGYAVIRYSLKTKDGQYALVDFYKSSYNEITFKISIYYDTSEFKNYDVVVDLSQTTTEALGE